MCFVGRRAAQDDEMRSELEKKMNISLQKQNDSQNEDVDDDSGDEIGPPLPPDFYSDNKPSTSATSADDSGVEDEEEDETSIDYQLPISHQIVLQHSSKPVCYLCLRLNTCSNFSAVIRYRYRHEYAPLSAQLKRKLLK